MKSGQNVWHMKAVAAIPVAEATSAVEEVVK